ncbi:serine protease inhibitor family protein [Hyalangium minutum]|uniref:Serine protease inhibitor family protein n=1 Tax=Hyalangium minutum TaxID=394096 RepID=A0A085W5E9_9BACT|nr:serine protease inhibitor family protein [Hyalangium minutum]
MGSRRLWLSPVVTALLMLAGCSSEEPLGPEIPPPPGELIASSDERVTPAVAAETLASAASGNTDFGAALYPLIARPNENLFFSPFSITQAFAMVYAGARGNTAQQMSQALHFPLSQEQLHPAMNALDLALNSRAAQTRGPQVVPPEFRVVNATWGQRGFAFEPAFLDVLAQHYGTGMHVVDFSTEAESLRTQINDWVAGQTHDRIKDLLPEGSVKSDTKLALTNALYFKGAWAERFDPQATVPANFHLLGGGTQQVQLMQRTFWLPYKRGEDFQAFALPYSGGAFRMLFIVPDSGQFPAVEARLSAEFLDSIRGTMENRVYALGLPRFRVETEFSLVPPLQQRGMTDAFSDTADLSGISQETRLKLSTAQHKAFVAVDENGTEAAAATGVTAVPVSIPEPLIVDRPFLFLIEDVETRTVLFLGRIVKP